MANKDKALIKVIQKIKNDINDERLITQDNWAEDLEAIGLVNREKEGFLIYISVTWLEDDGVYAYVLEYPAQDENDECPYVEGEEGRVGYQQLLAVVKSHLFNECVLA